EDFPGGPMAGIAFQRHWESLAFQAGGGDYRAPGQKVSDLLAGRPSSGEFGAVVPSYQPGVTLTDLSRCLPDYVIEALREAIPALTETGCNALTEVNWYTDRILKPLRRHPELRRIAWILVWRNANPGHFYAPYPGHPSSQDFINFKNDALILFEDEMPSMYQ
ncbi:MAG TPA: hypothetical protein PLG50_16065, partial [bacterium]|nr:hypothetical protein [bacterium]